MNRKKFVQKIDDDEAERSVTCTQLAMVDSALCQNNFSVASKYLEQSKKQLLIYEIEFITQSFRHHNRKHMISIVTTAVVER